MKKGGFLRNVLDTIRSNQSTSPSGRGGQGGASGERALEFGGLLKPSHFSLSQVARHGFPEQPTSLAFDPVQKISAIGTKSGAIRVFGRPGVDVWAQHKPSFAVTHIKFIINQGALITVLADESIHLWSLRGPNLKLQFSSGAQGISGSSPLANSPAPTPASNISSISTQSGGSVSTAGPGLTSTAASPSSFLGQITDTVSGAVDTASDFLSGGGDASEYQASPSPTSDIRHTVNRQPELLHTLKFQREHITCIHQTLTSKWLYIGTERGNVHVANVETFELSGYSIAWNKAIELSRKTHPGAIIHISECPQDTNKLLIGYESGCIVIWDLKQRNADGRYYYTENLLWLSWHYEGKQFVAAHGDGSLITWQTRSNTRPAQIVYPHAKTASTTTISNFDQQQSLTSSLARSLNNELYRPINKVEWKILKSSNEPFYIFSGGLPQDGFDQAQTTTAVQDSNKLLAASTSQQRQTANISSSSQLLKPSSASSSGVASSPMSPLISPNRLQDSLVDSKTSGLNDSRQSQTQPKEKKCLRSTSLTVMCGKSITVLEMDDTIIDFIVVCDNSPYENDTSDPYAVIVLLSNELILIDLTSSGYPSFDSPYPSASLNESPVTCVQYLADCSSDLIPFLYSTSQNVISRAPKKGFSDKEWPINGGEWGQSMQSYPELVLTGHADGTIKFWDMSGVNFDLISKIKTSKIFEKPNKPPNTVLVAVNNVGALKRPQNSQRPNCPNKSSSNENETNFSTIGSANDQLESNLEVLDDSLFAIQKIEFCSTTKRLIVAGTCAQVIQFKLNKKDSHLTSAPSSADLTTILVEHNFSNATKSFSSSEQTQTVTPAVASNQNQWKQHCLFQVKGSMSSGAGSSSSGSSSSSSSNRGRGLSGFQAELVCLTPSLISTTQPTEDNRTSARAIYCRVPPRITALAFQPSYNILAYAHTCGIVLIDTIQRCVIINASLSDLYGGSLTSTNNRDISIQPYATSSILQHHYQATCVAPSSAFGGERDFGTLSNAEHHSHPDNTASQSSNNRANSIDNEKTTSGVTDVGSNKNICGISDGSQVASPSRTTTSTTKQPPVQSRYTNSMFQRQLSTNALNINAKGNASASTGTSSSTSNSSAMRHGPRLFHRQMTASQLFTSSSSGASATSGQRDNNDVCSSASKRNQLTSTRADASLASSAACLTTATNQAIAAAAAASGTQTRFGDSSVDLTTSKKAGKNKRIISRMLSISAIHPTVTSGSSNNIGNNPSVETAGKSSSNFQMRGTNHGLTGGGGSGGGNSGVGGYSSDDAGQSNDTAAFGDTDKFNSSFRRSRSSSTSSTTGPHNAHTQHHQAEAGQQQLASEIIQCIAFLDPAQATPSGASSFLAAQTGSSLAASGAPSGPSGAQGAAPAAGQPQSSAGPNHKSHGSIDHSQAGQLALWLGTSTGAVLLVCLQMPESEDNRVLQLQSISAEPLPQASIKLNGQILCISPITCEARLQSSNNPGMGSASAGVGSAGQVSSSSGFHSASQSSSLEGDTLMQSPGSSGSAASVGGGVALSGSSGGLTNSGSVAPSGGGSSSSKSALESTAAASFDSRSSLFLAVVSEKQARIYQIPSSLANGGNNVFSTPAFSDHHHGYPATSSSSNSTQAQQQLLESPLGSVLVNKKNLVAECELSDSSYACRSAIVQMRSPDESCLVSYLATGNIVVHALPRLRPVLLEADFVPYSSPRLASSMCLSRQGHCLYQPSAGEICKFTVNAHYKAMVNEMIGLVHVPREMPEMPRTNFFKSLFSVSQSLKQSDRDELFGECSAGKALRGVAKHIGSASPNSASGLDKLKSAAAGTMGHDMRVAREGLDERGEKLSEIEDRTLSMMNQSEGYAQAAHQLAQKFKDKKWYQF